MYQVGIREPEYICTNTFNHLAFDKEDSQRYLGNKLDIADYDSGITILEESG